MMVALDHLSAGYLTAKMNETKHSLRKLSAIWYAANYRLRKLAASKLGSHLGVIAKGMIGGRGLKPRRE
jgi:hypothetical protein